MMDDEVRQGFDALERGDLFAASQHAQAVLRAAPQHPGALMLSGRVALVSGRLDLALTAFRSLTARPGCSAEDWLNLGRTFLTLRRDEQALDAFRQAVAREPTWKLAWQTLGEAYLSNNQPDAAAEALRRILALDPRDTAAYEVLPRAADIAPGSVEANQMEALLGDPGLHPLQRARLHYGLSRIYKAAGDGPTFIKHMFAANAAQVEAAPGRRRFYERTFDFEESVFTPAALSRAQRANTDAPTPIFIVGLPRSGTTLVEQIIGGHRDVRMGGELLYAGSVLARDMEEITRRPFPEGFEALTETQMNALGQRWARLLSMIADGADFITDKTPSNYHSLGLLPLFFPNCKIISVRRDPMDTAFSILQQPFDIRAAHLFDIKLMAYYFARHQRMMEMWDGVFGERVLTVRYEELVERPEAEGRRLASYCGLEWDASMLDLQARKGAVHTFSAQQVRRGVYREGVGAWRAFERDLEPVRAALKAEGVAGV